MTKQMYHYRWSYALDIAKAARILPLDRDPQTPSAQLDKTARFISDRQVERLRVVGSNSTTKPVIEESYQRILGILDRHIQRQMFMMGERPGSADFGIFGQFRAVGQSARRFLRRSRGARGVYGGYRDRGFGGGRGH